MRAVVNIANKKVSVSKLDLSNWSGGEVGATIPKLPRLQGGGDGGVDDDEDNDDDDDDGDDKPLDGGIMLVPRAERGRKRKATDGPV